MSGWAVAALPAPRAAATACGADAATPTSTRHHAVMIAMIMILLVDCFNEMRKTLALLSDLQALGRRTQPIVSVARPAGVFALLIEHKHALALARG